MRDQSAFQFKVSLNSALEFGVLYDPNDDTSEATVRMEMSSLMYRLLILSKLKPAHTFPLIILLHVTTVYILYIFSIND